MSYRDGTNHHVTTPAKTLEITKTSSTRLCLISGAGSSPGFRLEGFFGSEKPNSRPGRVQVTGAMGGVRRRQGRWGDRACSADGSRSFLGGSVLGLHARFPGRDWEADCASRPGRILDGPDRPWDDDRLACATTSLGRNPRAAARGANPCDDLGSIDSGSSRTTSLGATSDGPTSPRNRNHSQATERDHSTRTTKARHTSSIRRDRSRSAVVASALHRDCSCHP